MAKKPLIGSLNRAFITSPDAQVARRLIFSREASQSPVEPPSLYRVPTARSFPSCATALNRRGRTLASCWRSASITANAGADVARIPSITADDSPLRRILRSEAHTSELQSLMRISYAVFCLKQKIYQEGLIAGTCTSVHTIH